MKTTNDLIYGNETKAMLSFAIPMIIGNLFQQLYNVADSIIVGRFIGPSALAAVGSSFTVMVFLTSIILGLCMGSGAVFSFFYGAKETDNLKNSLFTSFCFIGIISLIINICALIFIDEILSFIHIPAEVLVDTKAYIQIIFYGITFTSIYNYFAAVVRSMGNSIMPLIFLIISTVINIVLDIIFVVPLDMGVKGAAYATIIAQCFSGVGIAVYSFAKVPQIRLNRKHIYLDKNMIKKIANYSVLSSIQQSIMNFGILMIQGLVNSFGVSVMAAFAAAVKIDNFAYMPVQDFGNAFSTFIAQNKGAEKNERIRRGIRSAVKIITIYCVIISVLVLAFAKPLLHIFIDAKETEILHIGRQYLFIVASFYCLIGYLFMFYGLFRGIGKSGISIVLTIVSLGTRVILAYALSPVSSIGIAGIWWAIPIGWGLADIIGIIKVRSLLRTQ
ncbi:MATE family efflux transporter [Anaerocolumna sp.]|uniref:MATE family efflux transporter n=1 Tax=Anaerocolumna sp. TaxID=2041569 RepID=UPI003FA45F5E